MLKSGNIGPTGQRLPNPDLLLLSYTGCFTFMKWFELLREEYHCPVAMLHVPYQARRPDHRRRCATTWSSSCKTKIIPTLEQITRPGLRRGPAAGAPARSRRRPRTTWSGCCSRRSTGRRRSTPTSAASTTSARSSAPSAAPQDAVDYYRAAARGDRGAHRARAGAGDAGRRDRARSASASSSRGRPTGRASASSGRCSPTRARWSWPRPTPRSAASTTWASATIRRGRSRRSPTTASAATRT